MKTAIALKKPKYYLNAQDEFVIENYNFAKPMANFFPGIAGKYGIPMWVFYVNRGQAIASFGTKDKDHSILEFFAANKSWQLVPSRGFRTFLKLYSAKKITFYEPFSNGWTNQEFNIANRMRITAYDLKIEEDNLTLGLRTTVEYFSIPGDSFAALARIVTFKNLTRTPKTIQLLDGLPQIVPYGVTNLFLKKLGRTIEAWMGVENLNHNVPFFKLDVDPTDRPQVIHIQEGNFFLGFHYDNGKPKIVKPIVDPQYVFAEPMDLHCPLGFLAKKKFVYPKNQAIVSKTPGAFILLDLELPANGIKTIFSVIGNIRSMDMLNRSVSRIIAPAYLTLKREENKKIIEGLQSDIATKSGLKAFDLYAQQTYLDNIMRGGYPVIFKDHANQTVFYLYSRKHGDLERDYNKFQIQATYFSQGNGNYRDMNQNRRNDTWFNPEIKDENIITFFNLLQADGFNPLVIKGATFSVNRSTDLKEILKDKIGEGGWEKTLALLEKKFTPGELILFIEENQIKLKVGYDEFLNAVLSHCQRNQEAEHGEGYWSDHWTYNLELLESYLGLYPEDLKEIVFAKKIFTFYDNTEVVRPRSQKYVLENGLVRQLHAVSPDNAKREMIKKRTAQPHLVRTQYGNGLIYETSLINKLFCLLVNKLASLDFLGTGIEMEADKPNWFDALNGLPALLGSSVHETFGLKRLVNFILETMEKAGIDKIALSEEIYSLLIEIDKLTQEYFNSGARDRDFIFWDKSHTLKEDYRQKTRFGFSGKETETAKPQLSDILKRWCKKIDEGIERAHDKKQDVYYSYFINEVKEYKVLEGHFVRPERFLQKKLPIFLEAQVHALRAARNLNDARGIYRATQNSPLYDQKLKMYKVTAPLSDMPEEIGRCRVFAPGWLENESIWMHMEYKYLLETLKSGLYEEFYRDFRHCLIPFQEPEKYGRSILENSSFIVSSAFLDQNLHGNGFVARLSGSTAEFINIWLIINLGKEPFILNAKKELNLRFRPILPHWFFSRPGGHTYSFNFLGRVLVVYYNPKRKNTFGKNSVKPKRIIFEDKNKNVVKIDSDTIPSPYAQEIRSRQIQRIDIHLG